MESVFEPPTASQIEKIHAVLHAIQTGVAFEHQSGSNDGSPKHLRVGVNNALCSVATITKLMVEKGIITSQEYWEAYIEQLEEELKAYKSRAPKNVNFL